MTTTSKRYRLPHGYVPSIPLFPHQLIGAVRLEQHDGLMLNDDPGLGKTLTTLVALADLMYGRVIDGAIIVCKAAHTRTWLYHLREFFKQHTFVTVVGKSREEREDLLKLKTDFYLINYELMALAPRNRKGGIVLQNPFGRSPVLVSSDVVGIIDLLRQRRMALVVDESQYIRTPTSRTTRILCAIAPLAKRRYALTGTPVAERPENVWSQAYFVDGGKRLGRSFNAFLTQFASVRYNRWGRLEISHYTNLPDLRMLLRAISVRRRAEDCLCLPPKVLTPRDVFPQHAQHALLKTLVGQLIPALDTANWNLPGSPVSRLLHALQRATVAPWLVDPKVTSSAKLAALRDIVEDDPHPLVIWCYHQDVAEELRKEFSHDAVMIHGGVDQPKRNELLDQFISGRKRLLIGTLGTLRESVTLVNSRRAIYMELGFSLLDWTQSKKRIDRIGQTGTVVLEPLFCQYSLDDYIWQSIQRKENAADYLTSNTMIFSQTEKDSLRQYLLKLS